MRDREATPTAGYDFNFSKSGYRQRRRGRRCRNLQGHGGRGGRGSIVEEEEGKRSNISLVGNR